MASKKLEEKYQKLLKEVQRRPENRTCFDCGGRGNQYVVLNFNTFICTTCSGIHREMQHRIKGVNMSTFSTDEIKALDKGGNAVAKATWMAKWGTADGTPPSEGEVEKLRRHIKDKYENKRWYSEAPAQPTPTPAVQPAVAAPAPVKAATDMFAALDPFGGKASSRQATAPAAAQQQGMPPHGYPQQHQMGMRPGMPPQQMYGGQQQIYGGQQQQGYAPQQGYGGYPPQGQMGMSQPGMPQQGMPQQGMPQQGMPQQGYGFQPQQQQGYGFM